MWVYCIMKMGFKVYVFENNTVTVSAYTTKWQICENSNVIRRHITCSVYRYACVCRRIPSVSLQCAIAIYWPGMNNTAFLVVFLDPCECGSFWQCCHLYVKLFQNQTKTFLFLVHLCCVNIPLVWKQSIIYSITLETLANPVNISSSKVFVVSDILLPDGLIKVQLHKVSQSDWSLPNQESLEFLCNMHQTANELWVDVSENRLFDKHTCISIYDEFS